MLATRVMAEKHGNRQTGAKFRAISQDIDIWFYISLWSMLQAFSSSTYMMQHLFGSSNKHLYQDIFWNTVPRGELSCFPTMIVLILLYSWRLCIHSNLLITLLEWQDLRFQTEKAFSGENHIHLFKYRTTNSKREIYIWEMKYLDYTNAPYLHKEP